MKVYIGKYRNHWVSPYTILERVLFWLDWENIDYDTPWVERWANRIEPFSLAWRSFLDTVHPPVKYVKIDRWDTWSMDHTLAYMILPMLRQLRADKQGAPLVDDADVPEELRSTTAPPKENEWDTDANHFKRWDWVLDEMIQAFECKVDDTWEEQYSSGEHDIVWKSVDEDGNEVAKSDRKYTEMTKGPNDTYKCDYDALHAHQKRNANGFRLFGKYYEALWD